MRKKTGLLLSLLMLTLPLAGCIGGEEFDTTEYENQIANLEAMLEEKNQTLTDKELIIVINLWGKDRKKGGKGGKS